MNEKEMLLKRVQVCDFALIDAALFLDLNPDNEMALSYYKKYSDMRKQASDEYVSRFGPIVHADYDGGERWKWVDGKWPWQTAEEE